MIHLNSLANLPKSSYMALAEDDRYFKHNMKFDLVEIMCFKKTLIPAENPHSQSLCKLKH